MLIAYDASGDVVATLDHVVARDGEGTVTGLIDFAAHEDAGGEHTDIWTVGGGVNMEPIAGGGLLPPATTPQRFVPGTEWSAKGSKVWPEWLGGRAHEFRVELEGPAGRKRIAALVHKTSGQRRERATVEANIALRIAVYDPEPADIRDVVGGPGRPLQLDDDGRVKTNAPAVRPNLPLIGLD